MNHRLSLGHDNPCRPRHFRPGRAVNASPEGPAKAALELSHTRLLIAGALFLLAFAVIAGRLIEVAGFKSGDLRTAHVRQGNPSYVTRADIVDRNGVLLATTLDTSSLFAVPKQVPNKGIAAVQLASVLPETNANELYARLSSDKGFVWLARQLSPQQKMAVIQLGIPGLEFQTEGKRVYPKGSLAAHVLGFAGLDNTGLAGIERGLDGSLKNGDAPVQLSIDVRLQYILKSELARQVADLKALGGTGIIMDVRTGEVLALANYPSYVPDKRRNLSGEQLRNRALTDTFEPGSVMKPFTIGLGLETGRVTPNTLIDTGNGKLTIHGATISDSHANGVLTVEGVIQKSSNIGTSKIAMQMQPREMWELFSQAGFGQKPQIAFPGAVSGRLRPYKTWRPIEQVTMSYGYGLSASLFQMARSYTVFSHDGQIIPATMLKTDAAAMGVPVLSQRTARQVRHMLQLAAGPGGTGQKAQTIGYSVGGKSGTAYKQVGKGYGTDKNRKYRAWFVGMAPIDAPRIIVAVMVDEPNAGQYFGGAVAAPVFSEVAQQTLRMMGVQPDMEVKPQIVANAVEESF